MTDDDMDLPVVVETPKVPVLPNRDETAKLPTLTEEIPQVTIYPDGSAYDAQGKWRGKVNVNDPEVQPHVRPFPVNFQIFDEVVDYDFSSLETLIEDRFKDCVYFSTAPSLALAQFMEEHYGRTAEPEVVVVAPPLCGVARSGPPSPSTG